MNEPSSVEKQGAKRECTDPGGIGQAAFVPPAPRKDPWLDEPVGVLPGVGPKRAVLLERLGIRTIGDLLRTPPRRFVDLGGIRPLAEVRPGERATCAVTVGRVARRRRPGGRFALLARVTDSSGEGRIAWFGHRYLARQIVLGRRLLVHGVAGAEGRPTFTHPEWEPVDHPGELARRGLRAFYRGTEGISQKLLRRLVSAALEGLPRAEPPDPLPADLRRERGWSSQAEAFRTLHRPGDEADARGARARLAFEELLGHALALGRVRSRLRGRPALPLRADPSIARAYARALPFEPTAAQHAAIEVILADLAEPRPMARLLQGEVGSGKTAVVAVACAHAVASGAQACVLAPTEVLAFQHAESFPRLLPGLAGRCVLLTASTPRAERRRLLEQVRSGEASIVIGTHAVLSDEVSFHALGLAVVDEQHRFGVVDRMRLRGKATAPHLLAVSATPIPRTLALALHGDLDLTLLDELPPGRIPVKTRIVPRERWEDLLSYVGARLARGEQAYFIYPVVGDSRRGRLRGAARSFDAISHHPALARHRFALLHGEMAAGEVRGIVERLRAGAIDGLVATTVVEVGFDLPRATVMIIEHPERYGLSQLHQLRGRIGRAPGGAPYCFLIRDAELSPPALARMRLMVRERSGARIAAADLALRGPGDLRGSEQAGPSRWRTARLPRDGELLVLAGEQARRILEADPSLRDPALAALSARAGSFGLAFD
jgi:ATP-dependent DNA helicase RecG